MLGRPGNLLVWARVLVDCPGDRVARLQARLRARLVALASREMKPRGGHVELPPATLSVVGELGRRAERVGCKSGHVCLVADSRA